MKEENERNEGAEKLEEPLTRFASRSDLSPRTGRGFGLVVLLVLMASGCAGPAGKLAGAPWRLEAIERDGSAIAPVASRERPSIEFTPEGSGRTARVNGFGGVNRYFGTCTFEGNDRIEFSELGATMMAGPPELMELESAFLGALGDAESYRRYHESLWLYFDDGLMRLSR